MLVSREWFPPCLSLLRFSSESLPKEHTESAVGMAVSCMHGSAGLLITAMPARAFSTRLFFLVCLFCLFVFSNYPSVSGESLQFQKSALSGVPFCHHLPSYRQTRKPRVCFGRGDGELNNIFYYPLLFAKTLSFSFSVWSESSS